MPSPDTISIVTPTHPGRIRNGMLQRALDSAYAQTWTPDAVCLAIDTESQGAAATRDRALQMARTEWVAFLDSDDILQPKHLQWLLAHALEQEADFVYSWFRVLQQAPDGSTRVLDHDPIFPATHYLNDFDPADPIETTITTLVRTEIAQAVGFKPLDRGHGQNSGEDYGFLLGCLAAGAKVSHLKRRSWLWTHHQLPNGERGNTSGLAGQGDAA